MANNRMFLVHRPTGTAICVARKVDDGWQASPYDFARNLDAMFEYCLGKGDDDYVLVLGTENDHSNVIEEA